MILNNRLLLGAKMLYSVFFFSLALYQCINFTLFYVRYGSADMINQYHLEFTFIALITIELLASILVWFNHQAKINLLLDVLMLLYFPFVIGLFIKIDDVTNGCIECHMVFNLLNLNFTIMKYLIYTFCIGYFFLLRKKTSA